MNFTEAMNSPAELFAPEFNMTVIVLLSIFAVCMLIIGIVDIRKHVLHPWWAWWAVPLGLTVASIVLSANAGTADGIGAIVATALIVVYYILAGKHLIGGADFWGHSLCFAAVGVCLGWIPLLIFIFIGVIFVPAISKLVYVMGDALQDKRDNPTDVRTPEQRLKGSLTKQGNKIVYLLPAPAVGFICTLIIWFFMWSGI